MVLSNQALIAFAIIDINTYFINPFIMFEDIAINITKDNFQLDIATTKEAYNKLLKLLLKTF